jgi:Fe2+ or Zn2+ uptake regulation protein
MTIRLTKKREQILEVLKNYPGTLSAADIHAQLPTMDLVTIYRNLELFTAEKMITELHLGTNEAQYEYQHEPHHHAVCTNCDRVIHVSTPTAELKKLLAISDFAVDEIEITLKGTCRTNK